MIRETGMSCTHLLRLPEKCPLSAGHQMLRKSMVCSLQGFRQSQTIVFNGYAVG